MPETNTPIQQSVKNSRVSVSEDKRLLTKKPIISCVAAGQGGYNGMRAMLDKPFVTADNCFYINYQTDLLSAKILDTNNLIDVNPDSYGAGKNREKARNDALSNVQVWSQELASKINPKSEKIYVFISGGGGFGSGSGPLIAATISQPNFMNRVGRKIPVHVILFKPALSNNREEWFNYSECLKELNALVDAKAISLFIADLSSSDEADPDERNLVVDREVAELLYRFECLNYIGNDSNLDFEDRYVLSCTPKMHALMRVEKDGTFSSPFVLPKGELVNRSAFEVAEGNEANVEKISQSLGVTVLDKSFKGVYPGTSSSLGAYDIIAYAGFKIPEGTLKESQNIVTELQRKAEAQDKSDKTKSADAFNMLKQNKAAIAESNQSNSLDLDGIMGLIGGD